MKVLRAEGARIELDVGGEAAVIEGWPDGSAEPLASLAVNGESARIEGLTREGLSPAAPARGPTPTGEGLSAPAGPKTPPATTSTPTRAAGEGIAVVPPMPGKVVEVRVKEGDVVRAGQVLVVLEAMKMRNEVPSPAAGRVTDLRVSAGSSATARDAMLRIVPG